MANGDHMEPTPEEKRRRAVCKHIIFLSEEMESHCPQWATRGAESIYGAGVNLQAAASVLAGMCKAADENIIYNARDPRARALAGWWEGQQVEREREAERKVRQARQRLVQDATESLERCTDDEVRSFISLVDRTVDSRIAHEQRLVAERGKKGE
jgi:hypothetical protein